MAASVQFRPQTRDLGRVMREVDENLAIFLGIKNDENKRNEQIPVEDLKEPRPHGPLSSNLSQSEMVQITADDNLLNLESENSDFDWLLAQPDASLLPSLEMGVQQDLKLVQPEIPLELIPTEHEPAKTSEESFPASNSSWQLAKSTIVDSSSAAATIKRPSSSGGRKPTSRAAAPTGRQALPAKPKPSRASTPTSRATLPSSKPTTTQSRSTTPAKAASRSSTPSARPSASVVTKSGSRSSTPTRKPSTPAILSGTSATTRSSSGKKTSTTMSKNPVPSRGTSPTVKSRPAKLSETLSHDAMENLKKSMPKRPASASRGRRSAPDTNSSSSKQRQRSCSPVKVRGPVTTVHKTGSLMLSRSRGHTNDGDDVNPVLMGTQMVERVVNMRKLAPPKQEEYLSHDNPRKSSQENSGFGRSLSKKSLDMAIRHMDIRRSINDNVRPASSSARSSYAKSNGAGASESPVASRSDSSESGNSINSRFLDGSEVDY